MTLSAFSAYRNYVWGAPEFEPVNLEPFTNTNAGTYPGLTIVDAMSTLWVMDLKEEWAAGREWIATKLHFADLDQVVRVREAFMDYLGGLLSAYALSGEPVFLEKAKEVYKALGPAFYESTGMLAYKFNPKVKSSLTVMGKSSEATAVKIKKVKLSLKAAVRFINGSHTVVLSNGTSGPLQRIAELPVLKSSFALAELNNNTTAYDHERQSGNFIANIGFQQPEFIYIANLTGDRVMVGRLAKSRELMESIQRPKGLYMTRVDASTGAAISTWGSLFDVATDFYYNAIRSYLQLGSWDEELLELYGSAIDAAIRADLFKVIGGRLYLRAFNTKTQLHAYGMEDTGCLLGGMLALSSAAYQRAENKERWRLHLDLAVNITETCHHEANSTATRLLPNKFILGKVLNNETWIA
ncbi:PREDICTED: mannosyl-oligosaccharide 1,2-alpha-mannosidase IA-like [Rhagoletis zephyria]|uniref:mannosyl-oligosaccharide 1,2-alpha-mannosidase IA-like n=1 Tax=Rhagoletis zephyria TaxID=28612 RepID=UPI00081157E1|nr:PREDICTED: mannosyl-oligosaccharide 1,2-alpha-mannosidase IA-like [Rhagoletis zephyria]